MAESIDEDAARFMRSQEIGVLESEFESRGNDGENTENELTSGKEQEVGEDNFAAEGQLRIAEESDDAGRETVAQSPVVSGSVGRPVAGFGQIDECDSEQGGVEGEGNCDDLDHSTESDNRHSLDYLCERQGKSLSYLVASYQFYASKQTRHSSNGIWVCAGDSDDPLDADFVPGSSVGESGSRRSKRLHSALPEATTKRSRVAALDSSDDEGSDDSLFLQLPEFSRCSFCHGRTKVVLMALSKGVFPGSTPLLPGAGAHKESGPTSGASDCRDDCHREWHCSL